MRRLLPALAAAILLGGSLAAPTHAALEQGDQGAQGPKRGLWTCESGGTEPFATVELFKGSKYAVDGDTEKGKYVYKAGKKKLKFKSGAWEGLYWGEYHKDSKSFVLYSIESTGPEASCSRDADAGENRSRR